jgi:Adenylate and Guanylate cyclase catalytic domain
MELFADRDPEAAQKIFDPVLERMIEAVHHYEGTVNRVIGDGIMALFGAPIAHEDHAVRACYAALRLQETVKQYAEELQRTKGMGVMIRVGLNSGEIVVYGIGNICTWNTPSWARRRTWPLVWNRWCQKMSSASSCYWRSPSASERCSIGSTARCGDEGRQSSWPPPGTSTALVGYQGDGPNSSWYLQTELQNSAPLWRGFCCARAKACPPAPMTSPRFSTGRAGSKCRHHVMRTTKCPRPRHPPSRRR